jgi:hypothetical protein
MVVVLVVTPVAAVGFEPNRQAGMIAPPIPDGPMLDVPAEMPLEVLSPPAAARDPRMPSWLEEGAGVIPAGGTAGSWPPGAPSPVDRAGHATFGEGGYSTSACLFDQWGEDGVFACGSTSTQLLLGGYFSGKPGPRVPQFNYLLATVRYGWMLTCPEDNWYGRGNYEFLLDLSGAAVTSGGYGDYFAGPSFLLRYNFVHPGAAIVPYHQVGAGIVYTDAYKDRTQRAIGQQWELYLRYELGLRYFVAPNLSLDVEGGFHHMSNAGQADRNYGVNAWGGQVGLTYYFPWGSQ